MSAPESIEPAGRYVIEDWMGKRVLPLESFDSFESARDRISELANAQADSEHAPDSPEWEDTYNGVCEDLYAVLEDSE